METNQSPKTKKPASRRWWIAAAVAAAIVIVAVVGLLVWNQFSSAQFARQLDQPQQAQAQPDAPDVRFRKMVLGTWGDEYQGKRTMTLSEDGTGTMLVELTGWRAALSAPRLKFNMKWSIAGGHLKKQTISGEPEAQIKMILSAMGDHVDEPILELTPDRLLLLDKDGKTKYDWKRVK